MFTGRSVSGKCRVMPILYASQAARVALVVPVAVAAAAPAPVRLITVHRSNKNSCPKQSKWFLQLPVVVAPLPLPAAPPVQPQVLLVAVVRI